MGKLRHDSRFGRRAVIEIWKICPERFAEFLESVTTAIKGDRTWGRCKNKSDTGHVLGSVLRFICRS